ncbi:MAG TPA: hypothetical protein PLW10_14875 [Myxococcota bacterium]|nr:hypothetical protein [Myxococcota bacterium]
MGASETGARLPAEFSALERWADEWILPTLEDRLQKRLVTPMKELQAFYDDVFPVAEAAMKYLDGFQIDDLPEPAMNLMNLLYSLSCVSVATDVFGTQRDPNTGATWIYEVSEPPF